MLSVLPLPALPRDDVENESDTEERAAGAGTTVADFECAWRLFEVAPLLNVVERSLVSELRERRDDG